MSFPRKAAVAWSATLLFAITVYRPAVQGNLVGPIADASGAVIRAPKASRNVLSGPDLVNVDSLVFREFTITERFEFKFCCESLNFFSTPLFDRVTAALLGTTNGDRRQNQFRLNLKF